MLYRKYYKEKTDKRIVENVIRTNNEKSKELETQKYRRGIVELSDIFNSTK